MTSAVDLELALRTQDGLHFWAEVRYHIPGTFGVQSTDRDELPIRIDQESLLGLSADPAAYGDALTRMLFDNPLLTRAVAEARAAAASQGLPLRLQLHLIAQAEALHTLRWETLRDPFSPERPLLSANALVPFSRTISTTNLWSAHQQAAPVRRALVVVADPSDLAQQGLSRIDAAQELDLLRELLGPAGVTVLGAGQATLDQLVLHLNDGYELLYVLAHGQAQGRETYLYLENGAGRAEPVPGSSLVQRISGLSRRPRLIILGACQSAGGGYTPPMLALGPALARAGAPAVLAMQERISVETLRAFLSACLRALRNGSRIDLAVAEARNATQSHTDVWMPALFLCLRTADQPPTEALTPLHEALGRCCAQQIQWRELAQRAYSSDPVLAQLAQLVLGRGLSTAALERIVVQLNHTVDGLEYALLEIAQAQGGAALEPIFTFLDQHTIEELGITVDWRWYWPLWELCKDTSEDVDYTAAQIYSQVKHIYRLDAPLLRNKTSLRQIVHYLARYDKESQPIPPLVRFAADIQRHLAHISALYQELENWLTQYCAAMSYPRTSDSSQAAQPILVMELQEIDADLFSLRIWLTTDPKDKACWQLDQQLCHSGKVSWSGFLALFGEMAQYATYQNAQRIDIFLPNTVFFQDLENTPLIDNDFPDLPPSCPGHRWPLVVRLQKRYQLLKRASLGRTPSFMKDWHDRWNTWESSRRATVGRRNAWRGVCVDTAQPLNIVRMANQELMGKLQGHAKAPFLIAQGLPANRSECGSVADILIKTGVPIALWYRAPTPLDEPALAALHRLIQESWDAAGDLPGALHTFRQRACDPEAEEAQIAQQLLLLWDAPDQLPPEFDLETIA